MRGGKVGQIAHCAVSDDAYKVGGEVVCPYSRLAFREYMYNSDVPVLNSFGPDTPLT